MDLSSMIQRNIVWNHPLLKHREDLQIFGKNFAENFVSDSITIQKQTQRMTYGGDRLKDIGLWSLDSVHPC